MHKASASQVRLGYVNNVNKVDNVFHICKFIYTILRKSCI